MSIPLHEAFSSQSLVVAACRLNLAQVAEAALLLHRRHRRRLRRNRSNPARVASVSAEAALLLFHPSRTRNPVMA